MLQYSLLVLFIYWHLYAYNITVVITKDTIRINDRIDTVVFMLLFEIVIAFKRAEIMIYVPN